MSGFNLQLFNFIDFSAGCIFMVFAIYLYTKVHEHFFSLHVAWLGWCCGILGLLLILVSSLSFSSIVSSGCRWAMTPSSFIALLIAVFALAVGCTSFAVKKKFFNYLNDEGTSIGLTSNDVKEIKLWYQVIAYGLLCFVGLELLRFQFSRTYSNSIYRIDGQYEALMKEEDEAWKNKLENNKVSREQKYNDLRAYYKQKYKTPSSDSRY